MKLESDRTRHHTSVCLQVDYEDLVSYATVVIKPTGKTKVRVCYLCVEKRSLLPS